MQDTEATTMVSGRRRREDVQAWRSRSISSLIDESFSMYVSDEGTYASGW